MPATALAHYYFPGVSTHGGRDGFLVEIRPERGQPWLGTFAYGDLTPRGVSGIFTMPDPSRLCVVSKGAGYIVGAAMPAAWEGVRASPVIDVCAIPAQGLIVFAGFTDLVAYGQAGIKWRTERLTWDSLKIVEVTDTLIKGEFWDIRSEATGSFIVDLATGRHEGGLKES